MESIGEKLSTTREGKGYTVEQIARETNISKRYLVALETEAFDAFPGETYLLGFLRNYADYLGLNPEELVTLYRNMKIQEQPVPIDELLDKRSPWIRILIVGGILVVIALAVLAYLLMPRDTENRADRKAGRAELEAAESVRQIAAGGQYFLSDEILERRFNLADTIFISVKGEQYGMTIEKLADDLTLRIPGGEQVLKLGEERILDLNGDGDMDIKVYLRDIDSATGNPGAILKFDRFIKAQPAAAAEVETSAAAETAAVVPAQGATATVEEVEAVPTIGSAGIDSRQGRVIDLLEADAPEPFTLDVVFRGYCLFRFISDETIREERYFHKGETTMIEANRQIRLWISNAGSFTGKIRGLEVDVGKPGEVSTKLIAWQRKEGQESYVLRMIPVY